MVLAPAHTVRALALGRVNIGLESLHRPFCLQAERGCSKICHTSPLSPQCSLQRLAPRLVSTRHALAQPAMASTASSFGKASSVKSKRYPGLPLLAPSAMVSRSAAVVRPPLQPATSSSLRQIAPPWPRRALRQSRGASAGSGLRLCVNDDLLQGRVPLTTQGDNSRIRCSLSQECQHVLSSDFRPYNNKLLGTAPALQQEVALPANFMLRSISSSAPGFEAGVRLLLGGRKPSTVRSYDQSRIRSSSPSGCCSSW